MIAVVQRVARAAVRVEGELVGEIGAGMLVLVAVLLGDGEAEAERLAQRLAHYRFFPDDHGRMNRDVRAAGGAALVVSQFTLAADGKKGRRPSFDRAAPPALAEPLIDRLVAALSALGVPCASGRFGAAMEVELVNEGPVTLLLEQVPGAGE